MARRDGKDEHLAGGRLNGRLLSLDLLRGADIFLLTVVGPLVWAVHRTWGDYDHPAWWLDLVKHPAYGFSPWDVIQPLFVFMCGASVPLGFQRRLDENKRPTSDFWKHLTKRFLLLWLLSVFTHGNLCAFSRTNTNFFTGALLVLAVAMVFVSLWMLIRSWKARLVIPIAIFIVYAASMHLWGDYTLSGSLPGTVDVVMPGWLRPADCVPQPKSPRWLPCAFYMPMLMYAGVLAPAGALAVQYVRRGDANVRRAMVLAGLGLVLLALGWTLSPWVPMAKRMMTASFTAAALGWCLIALAACYYVTDVKGWRRGFWIFTLYGQCSLVAYVIDEQFRATFRMAAQPFVVGFPRWFGPKYQEMFLWFFMIALQTGFLVLWRKARGTHR